MTELRLDTSAAARLAGSLWRARGSHVARIAEVSSPPGGPVRLVVEDGAVTLAEVLRGGLSLGQTVTVLVPLAETIAGMSGCAVHGAVGVDAVRFDGSGAPVLTSFRSDAPGPEDLVPDGAGDRRAFRDLAHAVLDAVDPGGAADLLGLASAAVDGIDAARPQSLTAFAERLLALASPEPVRPGGLAEPREALADQQAVDGPPAGLRRLAARVRARFAGIRPRFWVPALAVVLGLGAAFAVLPGAPEDRSPLAPPSPSSGTDSAPELAEAVHATNPVQAAIELVPAAKGGAIVDDYGDVVLVHLDTASGGEEVLIERTEAGWRLRETVAAGG